jgi:hypothetical protein
MKETANAGQVQAMLDTKYIVRYPRAILGAPKQYKPVLSIGKEDYRAE